MFWNIYHVEAKQQLQFTYQDGSKMSTIEASLLEFSSEIGHNVWTFVSVSNVKDVTVSLVTNSNYI